MLNRLRVKSIVKWINYLEGAGSQASGNHTVGSNLDPVYDMSNLREDGITKKINIQDDATLWTPTVGKRIRVMRVILHIGPGCSMAAAGQETIEVLGGTTSLAYISTYINNAVRTTGVAEHEVFDYSPCGVVLNCDEAITVAFATAFNAGYLSGEVYGFEEAP